MTLNQLLERKGLRFFQTDKMSLDNYYYEPFQDDKETFEDNRIFETEAVVVKKVKSVDYSIFSYFLDGSRKPYKIGDMITTDNKFAPVVAGQVGAACCHRIEKNMHQFSYNQKNYILFYDSINDDDFIDIKKVYTNTLHFPIEMGKYTFDRIRDDAPTNAAVACIHKKMQDMEIDMLNSIVNQHCLSTDSMLVIDGSLQFMTQKFDPRIFYNVIGISKSFNPNLTGILKGKKQIGVLLANLEFGERTAVYKYDTDKSRYTIGAWYLRIRQKTHIRNPLDGIIKIEKMAMDDEKECGFDTSVIDNVSSSILGEIYPTCHGNDSRWNNHLYPIFLTEKYLKSKFMSDLLFINAIK